MEIQSGIFQFESGGMTSFMKELKPDSLEDIIAGVSLYRPGPMDQIPRYVQAKRDRSTITYTHPALEPILNVTYGCMVYQEQVMQIVRELGGYTLGQADLVRRAMGKKKLDVMAKEREHFIEGCLKNNIDKTSSNKIFDEMAEFAKYAFNKSHAAAYAVVSYQTAYLKTYYKEEFMAATLNSFLGNLDKVPEYIDECKRLGIEILNPDINKSQTKFTVDNGKIRFGLGSVKNVGTGAVDTIVEIREKNGEYKSFTDFAEKMKETSINKKCIESLIKVGAFDEFKITRATLLESFEGIVDVISNIDKISLKGQFTMFDNVSEETKYNYIVKEELSSKELLNLEKEMIGLYISGHPLDEIREELKKEININSLQIRESTEDGKFIKYGGIVTSVKKKFTRNNTTMAFVTIEDLYGAVEVIVFDSVFGKCSQILDGDNVVIVEGRLSVREDDATKIVARDIRLFNKKEIPILNLKNDSKEILSMIKYFSGEHGNTEVKINDKTVGRIYFDNNIRKEFEEVDNGAN